MRLFFAIIVAATLAACMNLHQLQAMNACDRAGFTRGTQLYVECLNSVGAQ